MRKKTAQKLLQKVKKDYNNIAESFDKTRQYDWKEFGTFRKYIKNNQTVADLGCGNGRFYEFIRKYRKIKYIGIDNSENLLNKAKKTYKNNRSLGTAIIPLFLKGNLLNLPLKNNSIDTTVVVAALHHIPSKKFRKKAVQEIQRILKPKGTLLLTVWNLFQPKYKKYIWKSRLKHILLLGKYDPRDTFIPWGKSGIKRYYYAFKPKELKLLLEKNGFKIIKEQHGNNLVFICRKK